jgi:hypothetical protein
LQRLKTGIDAGHFRGLLEEVALKDLAAIRHLAGGRRGRAVAASRWPQGRFAGACDEAVNGIHGRVPRDAAHRRLAVRRP